MSFDRKALRFFQQLKKNNNKPWFEANRETYEGQVREPMRGLIEEMNARFRKFAPEIGGDSKRGMFRINRDIRFSKDKSPYKTNAGCWFNHRDASHKVGGEANEGSAGFYFHLQPGNSFLGAGLWMPPRPSLDKLREAIADDPKSFEKVAVGLKAFGGLDDEDMLKRMPRGFAEDHPGAKWLRHQSFTTGRKLKDAEVTSARLPSILARDYQRMLPLVRWLNRALGYRAVVALIAIALGSAFPSARAMRPAALDTAYFAGGCFWGVEAVFEHVRGVTSVVSGYSGGRLKHPTYEQVSDGNTGHAESVRVIYDASQVSYDTLLKVFFSVAHDPTQLNRQGPDVGTQYRSAIFYRSADQERSARAFIAQLTAGRVYAGRIVTQLVPFEAWYDAETYHQDFAAKNPRHPYIVYHDAPKVAHLKRDFGELYRER